MLCLFQAHCAASTHMPLFGQILAALYQEDIVEEDDIRGWHILPSTNGGDGREGVERDNFRKCWTIGAHMIQQFDDQDSSESDDEVEKPTAAPATIATKGDDEDDSDETSSVGTGVPDGGEVSEDASEDVSASEGCSTATSTNASEDEDESEESSN